MCGRFTLKTPESSVLSLFPKLELPDLKPRYNIAPTQSVCCARMGQESDILHLVHLRWGLVPFWAKDLKMGARMINARSETVSQKPSFRNAFKKRRCLVFADGYYEWVRIGKEKQPYYITAPDEQGFCMAGLWESWHDKENEECIETCTVLTTEASTSLSTIHDRMPVVVAKEDFEFWLDNEFQDEQKLKSIFKSFEDGFFRFRPVSKVVNSVKNDSAQCVQPMSG